MINDDILVSKIVGSPNENAWSQASSTGKLYVVVSLFSQTERSGIIALGKETLEQIQREFFALDEKKLSDIKTAVENVFLSLDKEIKYSAIVATIKEDVLYIVTASSGVVLIERENNLAEVARGEENKIVGFSGRIKHNDIIILETEDFNKKISNKLLAQYSGSQNGAKLAEDLAPFILEDSKGQEAAIIIHFKNLKKELPTDVPNIDETYGNKSFGQEIEEEYTSYEVEGVNENEEPAKSPLNLNVLGFLQKKLSSIPKKQKIIIVFAIIILLLIAGSLFGEKIMDSKRVSDKKFQTVYSFSSEKFENANNLSSLNRGRALEEVNQAISNLEDNLGKFKEGSNEHKQLSELLNELKALRDELGGGSQVAGNIIFTASDAKILSNISHISFSDGNLVITGSNGYAIISEDGKVESEKEVKLSNIKRIISDDTYIYLLGNNVTRITIQSGKNIEVIKDTSDALDISYFGSNIYLLNSRGDLMNKYSGASYLSAKYFSNNPTLSGKPISFGIDSSVYILTDKDSIEKFTRGERNDDFKLGKDVKISENALLYANENLSNIYVLDIDNARIIQLDTKGAISKQFNSLELQSAKSFTVNSDESKAYVVVDDQVYSYDL